MLRRIAPLFVTRSRRYAWGCRQLAKHGIPRLLLTFGVAIGDDLLCTIVLRELRKRDSRGVWMMTSHPDLFTNNADVDAVVERNGLYPVLTRKMRGESRILHYVQTVPELDEDEQPDSHIAAIMCKKAGISGEIAIRPYVYLTESEKRRGRIVENQIAIHSSGRAARLHYSTKEWFPDRFQDVVNRLKDSYNIVQLGSSADPPLTGVTDLRGKTSIRQSAAILSQSLVFIGLVGGLMHLSRAVDCRSVIVYGGRELPSQSGYIANENLTGVTPCSPCWKYNSCDYDMECMRQISSESVVAATHQQISRVGTAMPVQMKRI